MLSIISSLKAVQAFSVSPSIVTSSPVQSLLWQLAYDIDREAEDQNEYLDGMVSLLNNF